MDLRGNKITIAEILAHPGAMEHIRTNHRKISPEVLDAAKTLTLQQVLNFANLYLPKKKVEQYMQELKNL